jgi:energy-coupling factor transporter ATP-binding protein EcfA2
MTISAKSAGSPSEARTNINLATPARQQQIQQILVERLFGKYSYRLPYSEGSPELARVFVLYGDNGSGKTTLLKMVYHLLSPEDKKGHRTFLSKTPFSRFSIRLASGTVIEARRESEKLVGNYSLSIIRDNSIISSVDISTDKDLAVRDGPHTSALAEFLKSLEALSLRVYYLSDDRRHQGEIDPSEDRRPDPTALTFENYDRLIELEKEKAATSTVVRAIMRLTEWVRTQTRRCSLRALGNINSLYAEVFQRIASSPSQPEALTISSLHSLMASLKTVEAKSKAFSRFGLSPKVAISDFEAGIAIASESSAAVLYSVLKPYVDSLETRLASLQEIFDTLDSFTKRVNLFFKDKSLYFGLEKGFWIKSGHDKIDIEWLSSGEKQLLLLFCNAVLARHHASIVLIDEPELSLNVKWQRKLIDALIESSGESQVQFLLATHSVELLAQHRANAVKLSNLDVLTDVFESDEGHSDDSSTG